MNYRGYFNSIGCDKEYIVKFQTDSTNSFEEILLDGETPLEIIYNSNEIIFQPTKISTATVSVVTDEYLTDLYTPHRNEVIVQVYCVTDQKIVWQGYLTPQIYSQDYARCTGNIQFDASDCLAALQYIDYTTIGDKKQIVTFKDIIDKACDEAGVDGYYWTKAKYKGSSIVLPEHLSISEKNFFSEDTDEPWSFYTVLEEMCRYLGITVLQWGTYFYFIDVQQFHTNEVMTMSKWEKSDNYSVKTDVTLDSPMSITKDRYRGNSHTISFAPLYNKATVKSNFYYPKYFIPDIDNDDYRTNRLGGSKCQEVYPVGNHLEFHENNVTGDTAYTPVYIYKGNRKHDADDSKYIYYRKLIDHEYYSPIYYTSALTETTPPATALTSLRIAKDYISGQLCEFGHIERGNTDDLSYEVASSIGFDKYLLIHTWDKMEYRKSDELPAAVNSYPPILKLNSGYTNPIIVDGNNSYICLYADAIHERYEERDYINPDWTTDPSEMSTGNFGWFGGVSKNTRPMLNFKLGIGNKWWNGSTWTTTETSFWVKARTETNNKDPELIDPSNWNSERDILNNIPFTDWTGADGYKIPLDNSIDMNGEIKFYINLPAKIAELIAIEDDVDRFGPHFEKITSGQNHWCWLKNIKLTVHNKVTTEKKDSDIVYGGKEDGGVIDENSAMELEEVTCKITTFPGDNKLSYSNVGDAVNGGFLTGITEPSLIVSHVSQAPEKNLLIRYINQYSSQTIIEELELDMIANPFRKIYDSYWGSGKHFIWDGATINLREGKQKIRIVETK